MCREDVVPYLNRIKGYPADSRSFVEVKSLVRVCSKECVVKSLVRACSKESSKSV